MRIAYVITRADAVGGATVHVRDLAQEMLSRGHEAKVFVGGTGPVTDQLTAAGVPFYPLAYLGRPVRPVRDLRAASELAAALRDFQPDLVSTHTAKAGWIGRAVCARLGLPVIYTPHGWPAGDRMSAMEAALYRLAERVASRWADAIVCVCADERELALAKGIAPAEQLRVAYNGVRDIAPELRARPASNPVRIVSVARFEAPKDHRTLVLALARLRSLEWELELVGHGPLEDATRALARELGISERVRFLGYQPDVAPVLARAQMFMLSSRSEAFPRSVLEAMRAGLPVIASDVGGLAEAVDNRGNGILVPRGDSEALAEAAGGLIGDPDRRQRLGTAARLTYESRFRLERMVERTVAVYEDVRERHARRQASPAQVRS